MSVVIDRCPAVVSTRSRSSDRSRCTCCTSCCSRWRWIEGSVLVFIGRAIIHDSSAPRPRLTTEHTEGHGDRGETEGMHRRGGAEDAGKWQECPVHLHSLRNIERWC